MLTLIILGFGIFSRIVVHTPNFTPVLSLALFGGMYLKGRQGIWVPLALMAISDSIIGFYGNTMVYVWGSILFISFIGTWLKNHKSWTNIVTASIVSSFLFFIITNFGDFLAMYPHTWSGLKECYILAVPFYRSTFASTVVYSVILFSLWEFLLSRRENSFLIKAL